MNCREYLDSLLTEFDRVKILSDKNGAMVLQLRNRRLGKDMIVKQYDVPVAAYCEVKTVRHKNMPEIYDVLQLADGQIVLEEFVRGTSVSQILECDTYTYRGACNVIKGVCAAVKTLHEKGIIHRDIKPENVMIADDGTVKLIDLNASRAVSPEQDRDTVILGTIGYAPPEQLGIAQSDKRTDIYAIGVLLNVMLTGEHPSKQLAKGRAGRIVQKCTLIDPDSRYASIDRLLEAL